MQRAGYYAHLDTELVGLARLALADAVHLGGVPGVQLGLLIGTLALPTLGQDALGLLQRFTQRLLDCRPDHTGLGFNLPVQASNDGALALDRLYHVNGFVLHRAVHDHPAQLLRLDQLEIQRHLDGLGHHPFI